MNYTALPNLMVQALAVVALIEGEKSVGDGHDIALQAPGQVLKNHRVINVMTNVNSI